MLTRPHAPTPEELDEAPELAIVAALDTTLEAALAAMLAANPELRDVGCGDDGPYDNGVPQPPRLWIADTILTHASLLRIALGRYRHSVQVERERQDLALHEFPF